MALGLSAFGSPTQKPVARAPATSARLVRLFSLGLLAGACASVCAQTAELDRIVVTGSREPTSLDRLAADVVLIDAAQIRDSTADSLEDLLRSVAGVQLSRTGAAGQSAGVFIRGAGSGNTVVLVDGVRIGSATLGLVSFEALSLAMIDRIEVLRGPGSSLYGADAVGGVVQIFTKRGTAATRLAGNLAVGEYGAVEGAVSISGAQGGFDYALAVGREGDDGVSVLRPGDQFGNHNPDKDGYSRKSASANLGYELAPGHRVGLQVLASRLDAHYDASEFAPPTYEQDNTPDFRNQLDTQVTSLVYDGSWNAQWTTRVQLSHNDDDLHSGGHVIDHFRTQRDQATAQAAWRFSPGQQVLLALERVEEKARSTSFFDAVERDNNAAVLAYSGQFGPALLQADVRHDDNSVYGRNTTGRLGASYELTRGLRVRALAGTTFRAPSFNDLNFPGYGVDTVTPERGRSVELGVNWRDERSEFAATLYRNKLRDMIGYEGDRSFCPADPAYDFGCARNINRAKLQGATVSVAHRFGDLRLSGVVDFLDARDEATGARLSRRAAHQESVAADYSAGVWRFGASLLNVGARPDGGAQLGSYTTVDLKAAWRIAPTLQLEARLLNATDRDIEPARDYQSLGRQAWIGLRYDGLGL